MDPVCGKCGDRGFAELLVCCFMCQDAYEHRYCFNKASDIFREDVKWACEDCLSSIHKKPTIEKTRKLPSRRSERLSSKFLPAGDASIADKPARKISSPAAQKTTQRSESSDKVEDLESQNTAVSTERNQRSSCTPAKKGTEDIQVSPGLEGKEKEKSSNLEAKGYSGGTLWIDLPGSSTFDDNLSISQQNSSNLHAQPIMDPFWKGSIKVCYKRFGEVRGVAAHLSTLACSKAHQEASMLPVTLHPDMVPRSNVWPKSFQEAEPNDESIGLYFFPEKDRDEKAFDTLVDEMTSNDLAMKCMVDKAELLVFTSVKLPCEYWRFQGRRYLWGVFRAKQTPVSSKSPSRQRR